MKFPRLAVILSIIAVLAEFCGRGLCNINDDCPNGVTNITGLKSGSIKSPNFPSSYSNNETVCWRITVPKGYSALLIIHSFDLELCENCQCDYLEISDVSFGRGGKLCGTYTANFLAYQYDLQTPPLTSQASGDTGYVRFVSDGTEHRSGFNATFLAVSYDSGHNSVLNATEDETLTFTSPDYGKRNYPSSFIYQWYLIVPEGRQVSISFDEFDLEGSPDCENDWVELREAVIVKLQPNTFSGQFGAFVGDRFCNSNKPSGTYQSSGNMMWVQFKTDFNSTTRYKGFKASFKAGVGKLTITSPLLPVLSVVILLAGSKFGLPY